MGHFTLSSKKCNQTFERITVRLCLWRCNPVLTPVSVCLLAPLSNRFRHATRCLQVYGLPLKRSCLCLNKGTKVKAVHLHPVKSCVALGLFSCVSKKLSRFYLSTCLCVLLPLPTTSFPAGNLLIKCSSKLSNMAGPHKCNYS